MKKIFLTLIGLLILTVLSACGSSNGSDTSGSGQSNSVTISIGHANPADLEISHYQQFAVKFKEIVEEKTNGEIKINIHPGSELGGEREMIEGVELGTLDGVLTSTAPLGNFAQITQVFDVPFLFRDSEHVYKVLDGEIGKEVSAELEKRGLKVLAWAEGGFGAITNSVHPIKSVEDLKGLKIRTMENEVQIDTFQEFKSKATPMAFNELFTALQQQVVDGQFNPISTIYSNKFYEVQDHLTITEHFYLAAPFIISSTKFNSLTTEQQQILEDAAILARDHERKFVAEKTDEYIKRIVEHGTEVIKKEEIDLDSFTEAVKPVYEKHSEQFGDLIKKIQSVE